MAAEQVYTVRAVNPETIACDAALFAGALLSIGLPPHPRFRFTDTTEEIAGTPCRIWQWPFLPLTADRRYTALQLEKWWGDEAWLAANPAHEFAIVAIALKSFGELARAVRGAIPRIIVRRGLLAAHIPATFSPAHQQHLLEQVEGRLPFGALFVEPAEQSASSS